MDILEFNGEHRWLSNFVLVVVELDGSSYPSVEHAYQAAKTLNLNRRSGLQRTALSSGGAKAIGKTLVVRPNWLAAKEGVMLELLRQKFEQAPYRARLLALSGELVEAITGATPFGACAVSVGRTDWANC